MRETMSQTFYTKDHEYIHVDGDLGVVGISDYAQRTLGDVVFVELPSVGAAFARADQAAVVESVKAASEVFAPVSGEVEAVNHALEAEPALVNEEPEGKGWFFRLRMSNADELSALMDAAAYQAYIQTLE
jgi:glycine cleavage system H protein